MSESVTSKSKPGAAPTPANERILVVDSDDNIRDLVVWNLSADYVVSSAATADDALDLDLGGFSLIILDTELRGTVSGYSFIAALRDDPAARSVPFIICSALDSEDDVIRGFDAGADDYIVKPFSLREMVARVKSLLRRLRLRPEACPSLANLPFCRNNDICRQIAPRNRRTPRNTFAHGIPHTEALRERAGQVLFAR